MSKEIENTVDTLLQSYGIPFSAQYAGEVTKSDWGIDGKGQRVDAWRVKVGGFETDYFSGMGNRKLTSPIPPSIRGDRYATDGWMNKYCKPATPSAAGVLYCLLSDAEAGDMC